MSEISIRRYLPEDALRWNAFVKGARNGHFFFDRAYMDYHADRFPDCSFVFLKGDSPCAVLPGTLSADGVFSSHAGLTFGGFVLSETLGVLSVKTFFELLDEELRKLSAKTVVYKPLPWIYASRPSEEDLYWLFRKNARLKARQIASTLVPQTMHPAYNKMRYLRAGEKNGLVFSESRNFERFWDLLDNCLVEGHSAHPVHSKSELKLLSGRFPENIRLFTVEKDGELLSGSVVYLSREVAHTQYLASSAAGRSMHAMDFLMLNLIGKFPDRRFFDWGTSCEDGGKVLNEGLAHQKETYAGRGVVYDVYEYDL